MGFVLPPVGDPAKPKKNKKRKNALAQLMNPVPKGPGLPKSHKQNQQKVLINHVLKGKAPIPAHQSTRHQMGAPTKKELNALGGKQRNVPVAPVAGMITGGGNNNSHMRTAQRIKQRNGGQTSHGDQMGGGNKNKSGGSDGKHPLLQRAKETIAAQINPQLAQYKHEIKQTKKDRKQQRGDLNELYRRLGIQIDNAQVRGDAANTAAHSSIADNYDTLKRQLGNTYDTATGQTNSELSRLGIQEAGSAATAHLSSDEKYLSGLAGIDKANSLSNSTNQSQSFDNLITMLGSQAKLSGTQKKATALQTAANAISELRSQKGALAATRKGAVDALFHQLKDAKNQAQADAAQQEFMNSIAAGKLGIEQGNLSLAGQKLSLDAANSSVSNDLKRAQALKYIRDAKAPYTSGSGSSTPKGFTGGLQLLMGTNTGHNAAAKAAKQKAISVYKTYFTHNGINALTALTERIKNGNAPDYMSLPQDLQGAIVDALTIAGAK